MEDEFSDSAEVEGLTSKIVSIDGARSASRKPGQGPLGFGRAVSVPSQPSPPLQARRPFDTVLELSSASTTNSAAAMRRHSVSFLADAQTIPDQNLDRRRLQRTPTPYYEEPPTDYPTESGTAAEGEEDVPRNDGVQSETVTSLDGSDQAGNAGSMDNFVRPTCVKQRHSVTFIDRRSDVDREEGSPSERMFRPVVEDRQDFDGESGKKEQAE